MAASFFGRFSTRITFFPRSGHPAPGPGPTYPAPATPMLMPGNHQTRVGRKGSPIGTLTQRLGKAGSGRERPVVAGVGSGKPVLELLPRVAHGIAQGIEAARDRDRIATLVAGFPHPFSASAAHRHELNLHSVHD